MERLCPIWIWCTWRVCCRRSNRSAWWCGKSGYSPPCSLPPSLSVSPLSVCPTFCLSVSHVRQTSDNLNAAQQLSATILQLQQQLYLTSPLSLPSLFNCPLCAAVIHRISISIDNTRLAFPACLPQCICIAFTLHSALLFKQIHGLINYFSRWQLSLVARRHVTSTVCIVCLYNAIFIAIFVPRTTTATNSLHCIVCKLIASLLPWIWISSQTMAAICRSLPPA